MSPPLPVCGDLSAVDLRHFAKRCKNSRQARRALSIAAVLDGKSRQEAAKLGGMDRQTLRDWVIRYNSGGVAGLAGDWGGQTDRLSDDARQYLIDLIAMRPHPDVHGVVRWRCKDLCTMLREEHGISYSPTGMSRLLKRMGYSLLVPRPQHRNQKPQVIENFKKVSQQG